MARGFFFVLAALAVFGSVSFGQSDARKLHHALRKYAEAYGGPLERESLESLQLEGVQFQAGVAYPVTIRRKRPHNIRYEIEKGAVRVTVGYDGKTAWRRTESGGKSETVELSAAQERLLRAEAEFDGPLFYPQDKREVGVEFLGRDRLDGVVTLTIGVSVSGEGDYRYHLDELTGRVLKKEILDGAGAVTMEIFYRDYREVDGFPFAHEVDILAAGKPVALTRFDRIRTNIGLLSFHFEKPD